MSYLRSLCLLSHIGVKHILGCVSFGFPSSYSVPYLASFSGLSLWYSLTFIYSFSGLSFLIVPSEFSNVYLRIHDNTICLQTTNIDVHEF